MCYVVVLAYHVRAAASQANVVAISDNIAGQFS